jgi:hypothetical protein
MPLWWPHRNHCACPRAGACPSPGKHPLLEHGLLEASDNPAVATRWWRRWPRANIGGLTGLVLDVVDLDAVGAADWLDNAAPDWRGTGPVAQTGKGEHRFYAATGLGNRTRVTGVAGFDFRGRGGYVVLAPSTHVSGCRYRWRAGPQTPLTPMPAVLADILNPPQPVPAPRADDQTRRGGRPTRGWSSAGLLRTMATATDGTRNSTLFWAASRVVKDLHAGRVTPRAATETLDDLEVAARAVGLDESEIARTIRSALRRGSA